MKSVLMICYHFPPAMNGGVQRSLRFYEYLPEFAWTPHVITTDLYGHSETAIHSLELRSIYKRLMGKYPAQAANKISLQQPSAKKVSLIKFINKYLYVPDGAIAWLPFSLLPALRQDTDIIYTTSPPASAHLLGFMMQKLKSKPWVMDLRDPWTIEPINDAVSNSQWRIRLEGHLETRCFQNAQAIILNTKKTANAYRQAYPELAHKFHVITNGYDPASFEKSSFSIRAHLQLKDNIQLISHVGSLRRDISVANNNAIFLPLLQAIQTVKNDNFRFLFIGNVPASFAHAVYDMGLDDIVLMLGQLPHADALQAMLDSDALLFFDPPNDGQTYVRGKLYEYAASEKPILAIAGKGASTEFLENLGNVLFAHPNEQDSIATIFKQLIDGSIPERNTHFDLNSINYRHLTQRFAGILDTLAEATTS